MRMIDRMVVVGRTIGMVEEEEEEVGMEVDLGRLLVEVVEWEEGCAGII